MSDGYLRDSFRRYCLRCLCQDWRQFGSWPVGEGRLFGPGSHGSEVGLGRGKDRRDGRDRALVDDGTDTLQLCVEAFGGGGPGRGVGVQTGCSSIICLGGPERHAAGEGRIEPVERAAEAQDEVGGAHPRLDPARDLALGVSGEHLGGLGRGHSELAVFGGEIAKVGRNLLHHSHRVLHRGVVPFEGAGEGSVGDGEDFTGFDHVSARFQPFGATV